MSAFDILSDLAVDGTEPPIDLGSLGGKLLPFSLLYDTLLLRRLSSSMLPCNSLESIS